MITKVKRGVVSTIKDVLDLTPKKVRYCDLNIGDYFEYINIVCVYIGNGKAIDQDGYILSIDQFESVRPINVSIEYNYKLIDKNGKEYCYD